MASIDVSQDLDDETEDVLDELMRNSSLPRANTSLKPKAFFENLRKDHPNKKRKILDDEQANVPVKPPSRQTDYSRRVSFKTNMQASASYGNEYLVFGAARNPREYSYDSFRTNLPAGSSQFSLVEEFLNTKEAIDAVIKWNELLNHAQALRKLDPAWQAEAEKNPGRWPKNKKDTSGMELEHSERPGVIETTEESSNEIANQLLLMTSRANDAEAEHSIIPAAEAVVTHGAPIDQPLNGVFNELHVDVTNTPWAPLHKSSNETTITNPSSSPTSSSVLTPPISPCIENTLAHQSHPITSTMPPPKSLLKQRKTVKKPRPNPVKTAAPKVGRKGQADVAELPWEVTLVVVSTGEEFTRPFSQFDPRSVGRKLMMPPPTGEGKNQETLVKCIVKAGNITCDWPIPKLPFNKSVF